MDGSRKKTLSLCIVIFCLIVSGVILWATNSGGDSGIESYQGEMLWLKCNNPQCRSSYQIDKSEYFRLVQHKQVNMPISTTTPPLKCKDCGKDSVYRAVKCPNCGEMFFHGASGPGYFPDMCPKCKFSQKEEDRKKR
jgi:ribosomal protein L37AE/L43A